jgi:hypothetical protein
LHLSNLAENSPILTIDIFFLDETKRGDDINNEFLFYFEWLKKWRYQIPKITSGLFEGNN